VLVHDPFLSSQDSRDLDVELVSLEALFERSHVVSIHTPLLEETKGLIRGSHVASMLPGATLINTSRGAVLDEAQLVNVLLARPDIQAILDVTDPEPPIKESLLFDLPNVILTPHIAGSLSGLT
jgi:phosphoglycerate dehydrogenase-like enzyme